MRCVASVGLVAKSIDRGGCLLPRFTTHAQTKTDFFRVEDAKSVALAGIDSVAVFTAMGDKDVLVRNYHLKFKKSGERVRFCFGIFVAFMKRR